ncbi:MAG: hypothetical protein IJU48_04840 [Synergistaceae bacterium]|nr:hypothetical protein [Synergistaceae bacterium]
MATVSINRIIKAEDKIVLAQEYGNIINNLDLSKIKPDPEITKIYTEILNLITSKILIKEETRFIRANYDKRVQNGIVEAITSLSVTSLINPQEFLEVLARECISTYFDYQFHHDDLREEMNRDLWRLKSEDIQAVNNIRKQQLESVWSLLYKYRDASGSRLVDLDIDYFYQAVNEPDNTKRLTDFRILEKKLKSYPPYWFYRAQSARIANKNEEYQSCLASFDEVWQPVLIEDPYKLEVCKYRFQDLMNSGRSLENIRDEALSYLDAAKENTPFEDWANNLFIGLAYYVLGEYEKGIAQVSVNVNFKHDDGLPIDTMYSPSILRQMTAGNDDIITFVSKLTEFIKHYSQEWKNSKLESKLDEKIEQNFHENTKYQWDERFFQDNEKLVKAQDYFVEGIARITRGFRLSTNWGGVFDKIQNDIYSSFRPEYEAFMKNFQAEYSPISQENISFLDIADKLEDKRLNLLWPALESQLSNPWTAFIILVAGVLIITFKNLVTNKLFPVFNYKVRLDIVRKQN